MLTAILFNDTSYNKHRGCQVVVKQIYVLAQEIGIRIVKACPIGLDWRQDVALKRDIAEVDLCDVKATHIPVELHLLAAYVMCRAT